LPGASWLKLHQIQGRHKSRHGQPEAGVRDFDMALLVGVGQMSAVPCQQVVNGVERGVGEMGCIALSIRRHDAMPDVVLGDFLDASIERKLMQVAQHADHCTGFSVGRGGCFEDDRGGCHQLVVCALAVPPLSGCLTPCDRLRRLACFVVDTGDGSFDVDAGHDGSWYRSNENAHDGGIVGVG